MVRVRFYLNIGRNKTRASIYCVATVRYGVNKGQYRATTGRTINPKHWSATRQEVTAKEPGYEMHNQRLKWWIAGRTDPDTGRTVEPSVGSQLEAMDLNGQQITNELLFSILTGETKQRKAQNALTFLQAYEAWKTRYLNEKNPAGWQGKKPGEVEGWSRAVNVKQYVNLIEAWKEGAPLRLFATLQGWEPYRQHLLQKVPTDSTRSKHIGFIRTLMEDAGLPVQHLKEGRKQGKKSGRKTALYYKELALLLEPCSTEQRTMAAHAFYMDCSMCLSWKDLSKLPAPEIVDLPKHGPWPCFDANREKTGSYIFVPLSPMGKRLYEQYGRIPLPTTSRSEYSDLLKKAAAEKGLTRTVKTSKRVHGKIISSTKPLHEAISSHLARHTGSSLIKQQTRDNLLASYMLAHEGDSTTDIYAQLDPYSAADDLIDAWHIIEAQAGAAGQ